MSGDNIVGPAILTVQSIVRWPRQKLRDVKVKDKPFEPIDDLELVELKELLNRISEKHVNDAGKVFIAQMIGMHRLVESQHAASKRLLEAQNESSRDLLEEQRSLIFWQKVATVATAFIVVLTVIYAYETKSIMDANIKMANTAQEQLDLTKQQLREARVPQLHVAMSAPSYTIGGDTLKSQGRGQLQFSVANKSRSTAYNLRCGVRLLKNKNVIGTISGDCRDTLFAEYNDGFNVNISRAQLINLSDNKNPRAVGIEAFATYTDAQQNGLSYTSIRRVHFEEGKDDAIEVKSLDSVTFPTTK